MESDEPVGPIGDEDYAGSGTCDETDTGADDIGSREDEGWTLSESKFEFFLAQQRDFMRKVSQLEQTFELYIEQQHDQRQDDEKKFTDLAKVANLNNERITAVAKQLSGHVLEPDAHNTAIIGIRRNK